MLSNSLAVDFALAVLTILLVIILFFNERYKYWKNRGIPYVKPQFLWGNIKDNVFGKLSIFQVHEKLYKELKGQRFGGYYEMYVPKLIIIDPELIHTMLVKDFVHFQDRGLFPVDPEYEPLTNNVANLEGDKWRNLRHKMTPTFSSGKLKGMYEQIYNCGEGLIKELEKYAENNKALDAKDVINIFTSDVIASCAFGLQFKINSPEGEPFKKMIKKAFPPSRFTAILLLMRMLYTNFSKVLRLRNFSKDVTEYFVNLSKTTVQYRKRNGIQRNDFLQLLLDIKECEENSSTARQEEEENDEDDIMNQLEYSSVYNTKELNVSKVMTDECLAASSFIFLVAGTEVSTTVAFLLYCIATNPSVQQRLQDEVDQTVAKHGGFNYQAIKSMTYMSQVIQETLRIYPAAMTTRICTIPYHIPGSNVVLEKGTRITIPIWAIHRDPQHYPEPERFDPDRFVGNNYKPTPTYLPFGDGPRICIAMRFAILEMEICLARIMAQYSVSVSSKTQQPLQFETDNIVPRPQGGIWINIKKRNQTSC